MDGETGTSWSDTSCQGASTTTLYEGQSGRVGLALSRLLEELVSCSAATGVQYGALRKQGLESPFLLRTAKYYADPVILPPCSLGAPDPVPFVRHAGQCTRGLQSATRPLASILHSQTCTTKHSMLRLGQPG